MSRLTISCLGCGRQWLVSNTFSIYEQQTVESCPCPCCGAYTLCCQEPEESRLAKPALPVRGWRATPVRL